MANNWFDWSTANAPPAPYWLPKYAPGEQAWQPMKGYPVQIPSGQTWSRTPWSQRMGLESYINRYAGTVPGMIASYQDLVEIILGRQPKKAPSGAARWYMGRTW